MSRSQKSRLHYLSVRLGTVALLLSGAVPATAQLSTGFEAPEYQGCISGIQVTGQQGWYVPDVAGSANQYIFVYDGNTLGLPANPFGEEQFLGGQSLQVGEFPRAQLNFNWSAATIWNVSYDLATGFNGTLPAADFLGSFSLQNSIIARYFIAVNGWVNPNTADQWNALYIVFDSNGLQIDPLGLSPGPAFRNLTVRHWYRQATTFDFDSNKILSVSITDLATGDTATYEPIGWYLAGGAISRPPLPTALRFFVGGGDSVPGNVGAWDNLMIQACGGPPINDQPDSFERERRVDVEPTPATN